MITCLICGEQKPYRLDRHLKIIHQINAKIYFEMFGEMSASKENREQVSIKSKEVASRPGQREKMSKIRKAQFTPEIIKKISDTKKRMYQNGEIKTWNEGLTKRDDPRLVSIGKKNQKHLTGRRKENYEYLQKHSDSMKEKWYNGQLSPRMTQDNKTWMTNDEYNLWRSKISKIISEKYSTGELRFSNTSFKTGHYKQWNYDSGLELETMIFLDSTEEISYWKKDFDTIKYLDENNHERNYIPDFFVYLKNGKSIVIETKGYDRHPQRIPLKRDASIKKYPNYFICKDLSEVKNIIYENSKN